MKVDLDKQDLIFLVKGCSPSWKVQHTKSIEPFGRYSELSGWVWNIETLEKCDEATLFEIYTKCKESK